jgi:hypothetical protein
MSDFNVTLNKSDVNKIKIMMVGIKNGTPKVLSRSINKTLTNVSTKAATEIRKDLNLTAKRVKADFKPIKATWAKPSGAFRSKGDPVGLSSFIGTKELARGGVGVKVKKSKGKTILQHAFIAKGKGASTGPDGNVKVHVFERDLLPGQTGKGVYDPKIPYGRLPKNYKWLKRLTGPRVEDELSKETVMKPVLNHADTRLTYHLNYELDRELSKL